MIGGIRSSLRIVLEVSRLYCEFLRTAEPLLVVERLLLTLMLERGMRGAGRKLEELVIAIFRTIRAVFGGDSSPPF